MNEIIEVVIQLKKLKTVKTRIKKKGFNRLWVALYIFYELLHITSVFYETIKNGYYVK